MPFSDRVSLVLLLRALFLSPLLFDLSALFFAG